MGTKRVAGVEGHLAQAWGSGLARLVKEEQHRRRPSVVVAGRLRSVHRPFLSLILSGPAVTPVVGAGVSPRGEVEVAAAVVAVAAAESLRVVGSKHSSSSSSSSSRALVIKHRFLDLERRFLDLERRVGGLLLSLVPAERRGRCGDSRSF